MAASADPAAAAAGPSADATTAPRRDQTTGVSLRLPTAPSCSLATLELLLPTPAPCALDGCFSPASSAPGSPLETSEGAASPLAPFLPRERHSRVRSLLLLWHLQVQCGDLWKPAGRALLRPCGLPGSRQIACRGSQRHRWAPSCLKEAVFSPSRAWCGSLTHCSKAAGSSAVCPGSQH